MESACASYSNFPMNKEPTTLIQITSCNLSIGWIDLQQTLPTPWLIPKDILLMFYTLLQPKINDLIYYVYSPFLKTKTWHKLRILLSRVLNGNGRFCSSYEVSPSSFRYYSSSVEYLSGIQGWTNLHDQPTIYMCAWYFILCLLKGPWDLWPDDVKTPITIQTAVGQQTFCFLACEFMSYFLPPTLHEVSQTCWLKRDGQRLMLWRKSSPHGKSRSVFWTIHYFTRVYFCFDFVFCQW